LQLSITLVGAVGGLNLRPRWSFFLGRQCRRGIRVLCTLAPSAPSAELFVLLGDVGGRGGGEVWIDREGLLGRPVDVADMSGADYHQLLLPVGIAAIHSC